MSRFESRKDIVAVFHALRIPEIIKLDNRAKVPGIEALCILLRHLAVPTRHVDLVDIFHRDSSMIARIFLYMLHFVYVIARPLLHFDAQRLNLDNIRRFAKAVHARREKDGLPLARHPACFGFIDGTLRRNCRPVIYQKLVYSGHRRSHGLKFQAVVTPDGIIVDLSQSFTGRRNDAYLLKKSGLLSTLKTILRPAAGRFYLYGDAAYSGNEPYIVCPGTFVRLGRHEIHADYSVNRVCVEWAFGRVARYAFHWHL